MTYSPYVSSSNDILDIENIQIENLVAEDNLDVIRVVYEYLFTSQQNLKLKNKFLFLFLQNFINIDTSIINRFFYDEVISELDISLLKSAIIITENIPEVKNSRDNVIKIFNHKYSTLI